MKCDYLSFLRVLTFKRSKLEFETFFLYFFTPPPSRNKKYVYFRGETTHPWLKNSPVFNNKEYLNMVYEDGFKKDYLNRASAYSKVCQLFVGIL